MNGVMKNGEICFIAFTRNFNFTFFLPYVALLVSFERGRSQAFSRVFNLGA